VALSSGSTTAVFAAPDEPTTAPTAVSEPKKALSKPAKKKRLATVDGAVEDGSMLVTDFFAVQRKRGAQKKKPGDAPPAKRGRPFRRVDEEPAAALALPVLPREAPPSKVVKSANKRKNWSKGENLVKVGAAVKEWDAKSERCTKTTTTAEFAAMVGIPVGTLKPYIRVDVSKRQKIGQGMGTKALLKPDESAFIVDVVRRADRGNAGMGNMTVLDSLTELRPDLTREQARNAWRKTIRPANNDTLTGIVKAQATTTKRTAITVTQQWRWHVSRKGAIWDLKSDFGVAGLFFVFFFSNVLQ
jgi:hypothetical protein